MDWDSPSKILDLKTIDNLLYLDLETTGLDAGAGAKIVEIAMVALNGNKRSQYQTLVNPGRLIHPEISKINSIYNDMVENAPYFSAICGEVLEFLGGNTIVCHNVPFDLPILAREIKSAAKIERCFYCIDTLTLARKFFNFESNSLQSIASVLGIEPSVKHRAMADVETLISVSKYLFSNMIRKGIPSAEAFLFKQ
ncbi:MAG: 3'-5' exonuclease [Elusimicrobiota bacterium]|nr:3'-5' exonuclease [Elusimicrobiota bacterium]